MDPAPIERPDARVPPPGRPEPRGADTLQPVAPPAAAFSHGWMPLASTGVDDFRRTHPAYDGRGVLIGILDTGVDPAVPGLQRTTTGEPKVLDLRDFSAEGAVALRPLTSSGDSLAVAGRRLAGAGRVAALSAGRPWLGGVLAEIPLGEAPAADLNGNGRVGDTLALVVTRAPDGWVLFADTDGDGSLANERPVHDYLVARETFGWAQRGRRPPVTVAVNFTERNGAPSLNLVFMTGAHGTHVAGIAAGHDLYGVAGFDGVAPGAQLLGLKIANSAQGGISTGGSIVRAIDYAIGLAAARRLPLVLNLSFGVGNELEGRARVDALVDSILAAHPDVVFSISAGNDGPGLSTVGFPGSARRAISVGASIPPAFLPPDPSRKATPEQIAYFSSRGGELAKPDLLTPGMAYSTVPRWNRGDEVEQGTSMAAPHAAGLAALLVSSLADRGRPILAREIKQALMVTAQPLPRGTYLDQGTGLADVGRAWQWLQGEHRAPQIFVRPIGPPSGASAAYRRREPGQGAPPRAQEFELTRGDSGGDAGAPLSFRLRSDAAWLLAPLRITLRGPSASVEVRYDPAALREPGVHVGTVSGWGSDSLAGPAFRLVNTIVVASPSDDESRALRQAARVAPGGVLRTFFRADSGRPFQAKVFAKELAGGAGAKGLAFLHEPDGMPFRAESGLPFDGPGQAAVYQPDARDVVAGDYEVDAVAPPTGPLDVTVTLTHAPLLLSVGTAAHQAVATASNPTAKPVRAEAAMLVGGGERVEPVSGQGSSPRRIPLRVPAWARGIVVDVTMEPAQWGGFTDFGVTLFDSAGRQLGKKPLNYAFGRLSAELPPGHGDMPVTLGLFPGFADPGSREPWSLRATIRLYADSAVALRPVAAGGGMTAGLTVAPGQSARAAFALIPSPWPLPPGFAPLGVVVARTSGQTWTREGRLPVEPEAASR